MDALIGSYEDEWQKAVVDPELRKTFKQFANTVRPIQLCLTRLTADLVVSQDERRLPLIENIEERGQSRPADWPKTFPSQKFEEKDITTPREEWTWVKVCSTADMRLTDEGTT
jgi:nitrite reductase (NAD(P)H)